MRALVERVVAHHVGLSPSDTDALVAVLRPMTRDPGELLFRREESRSAFVLFERGIVRTHAVDARGRPRNLRFLAAPNLATALSSVIRGATTDEWVSAVTRVEGFRADFDRLRDHPRFEAWMRTLAEQHYLALEQRVALLQLPFARDRYAWFLEHVDPDIVEAMPAHHVASYLGVTPETLSRAKRSHASKAEPHASR